jgi:hypothetical protein
MCLCAYVPLGFLMVNSTVLAKAVEKYRGKRFFLGDPSRGWDCLNSLLDLYGGMGYIFPKEMEGIDGSNYPDIWNKENVRAREVFARFLLSLGDPVEPDFYVRGDLLIFKGAQLGTCPAVFLGNGNIMMLLSAKEGIGIEPFRRYKKWLIAVRRLIK